MARNIKGITVEIGGDTKPLQNALKDVDKQVRTTQSNLKDINKLLKFSPSSTVLLKQKQEELSKAVVGTKDRLQTLKKAQEQYKAEGKDLNTPAYKALEREIVQTESKLNDLVKEQKQFGSVSKQQMLQVANSIKSVSDKISDVGEKATKNLTAPIVAFGAASIKSFQSVDDGMDTIVKKTGATGAAAKDLQKIYEEMYSSLNFDFADIGNAIGEVNTRFKISGKTLESLTTSALEFSSITDSDVTTSVANLQRIMSQFDLDTKDASSVLGVFASVAQDTGISVDDLFSEVQQYGGTFQKMNIPLVSAVKLLGKFEQAGYDSSTMMRALNKANLYAMKNGVSAVDVIQKISKELSGSSSRVKGEKDAIEVFGARTASAFIAMAEHGKFSLSGLDDSLSKYSSTVDKTYKGTQDGIDNWKKAFQSLEGVLAKVGDFISKQLGPTFNSLAKHLTKIGNRISKLPGPAKKVLATTLLVVAAAGPILTVIGRMGAGVSTLISMFSTIGPVIGSLIGRIAAVTGATVTQTVATEGATLAQTGLNVALLANPVGIIIAAIAAAVAVIVLLWRHCKSFSDGIKGVWKGIKGFFSNWKDGLKSIAGKTKEVFGKVKDHVKDAGEKIKKGALVAFKGIRDIQQHHGKATTKEGKVMAALLRYSVVGQLGKMSLSAGRHMKNMAKKIKEKFKEIKEHGGIVSALRKNVAANFTKMRDVIGGRMKGAVNKVRGAWKSIKEAIGGKFKAAYKWGHDLISGFAKGIKDAFGGIKDNVKNVAKYIKDHLHFSTPDAGPLKGFGEKDGADMVESFASGISKSMGKLKASVAGMGGTIAMAGTGYAQNVSVDNAGIQNAVRAGMIAGQPSQGDTLVQVQIGQQQLESIIVKAVKNYSRRSGGR